MQDGGEVRGEAYGDGAADCGPLWVFGYGSLIWNPGFAFAEARPARLPGFRRAFCMWSVRYRGTPEAPGLVLALDAADGAECRGLAYRAEPGREQEVREYLTFREMGTDSYHETWQMLELDDGSTVRALAYVADPHHAQYADLAPLRQAEIIAQASGPAGPNRDYLHQTAAHLRELGLHDPALEALDRMVREMS